VLFLQIYCKKVETSDGIEKADHFNRETNKRKDNKWKHECMINENILAQENKSGRHTICVIPLVITYYK
jgi:hypothetical protein